LRLLPLGLRRPIGLKNLPAVKERTGQGAGNGPDARPAFDDVLQFVTGAAAQTGQTQTREETGLGHANLGVRRPERLLGFTDVRPPLKQLRGEANGNLRRGQLLNQGDPTRNRPWSTTEQDTELVFLGDNKALEVGNSRCR